MPPMGPCFSLLGKMMSGTQESCCLNSEKLLSELRKVIAETQENRYLNPGKLLPELRKVVA